MSSRTKNALYSLFLILFIASVYLFREQQTPDKPIAVTGTTMGKIGYTVKYFDPQDRDFKPEIDSLLKDFNQSLSTYIPSSELSTFNRNDTFAFKSPFFYPVLKSSKKVYEATNGAFDPTVGPLVNSWGFGPEDRQSMTKQKVDSLLQLVGFNHIRFDRQQVWKSKPHMYLDFSANAKGYAIDVIAHFLEKKGINSYLVILGGEARGKGGNGQEDAWIIGVDNPQYQESGGPAGVAYVKLKNQSVATSGNYRNFYVKDGKKYAHTIHPTTGYPVEHSLLSASVFADNCMDADAYATALMVLGKEKGMELLQQNPDLQVLLVYEENGQMETYVSPQVQKMLLD